MRGLRKNQQTGGDLDPDREVSYYIAQKVFDLRTEQGLSQAELAERAGTKQSRISVVESATTLPAYPILRRIVEALGGRLVLRIEKRGKGEETE